ncbi:MAG: hypothetical protein Q8P84_01375 [Deltaproteobacteria bacterium]|nr:hypothetical protein [Deltaproteobacteria bacterium]
MVRWYRVVPVIAIPEGAKQSPLNDREIASVASLPRNDNLDLYIPPEASSQQTRTVPKWTWGVFSKRKAMEEVREIASKAERLHSAPDLLIRYFMENDLPRLMQYGEALPMQTRQLLAGYKNNSATAPWASLLRVAAGDAAAILPSIETAPEVIPQGKAAAYLYGLQKLAARFPKEATHLARQIFEKGDLNVRLAAFRVMAVSPDIGDGKMVGELFVKLMAATTHEERREIVEPFLQNLLRKGEGNKLAWLSAIYHGWKQES